MKKRMSTILRDLIKEEGPIIIPAVGDCLSLRIAERAGFKAVFHGIFLASALFLGMPDIGLMTMTEAVELGKNMVNSCNIPVICDIDDGFGGLNNLKRAIREVIRAGMAGVLIDDQVFPKRCPGLGGGNVISCENMLIKLEIINEIRSKEDPDFVIVGRSHSSRVAGLGMNEAVKRGVDYAKAGADMIFIDQGYSDVLFEELKQISQVVGPYAPLVANMTENIGRPLLTSEELLKMGFKIQFYPMTAILAMTAALKDVFAELKEKGTTKNFTDKMVKFKELEEIIMSQGIYNR